MGSTNKYETLLANWDVNVEQNRADFLDWLYKFYGCTDGYYTGLYQRFLTDIGEVVRDCFANDPGVFAVLKSKLKSK